MEFEEMKDRIAHIIRAKNMTAAEFAAQLGIQPSNVSHLLAGRNNPSLEFVKKLKENFPEYSLEWIVFGSGPMTVSASFPESRRQTETRTEEKHTNDEFPKMADTLPFALSEASGNTQSSLPNVVKSGLRQIVFVFDDHTFEVFEPR